MILNLVSFLSFKQMNHSRRAQNPAFLRYVTIHVKIVPAGLTDRSSVIGNVPPNFQWFHLPVFMVVFLQADASTVEDFKK